jgi:hypothetical protein
MAHSHETERIWLEEEPGSDSKRARYERMTGRPEIYCDRRRDRSCCRDCRGYGRGRERKSIGIGWRRRCHARYHPDDVVATPMDRRRDRVDRRGLPIVTIVRRVGRSRRLRMLVRHAGQTAQEARAGRTSQHYQHDHHRGSDSPVSDERFFLKNCSTTGHDSCAGMWPGLLGRQRFAAAHVTALVSKVLNGARSCVRSSCPRVMPTIRAVG